MKSGFTLVELLIVIGIIAALSSAVVLVLNPNELIKQSRDSVRLSDLDALNRAILFYQSQRPNDPNELGIPSVIYVSLPDGDPDCLTATPSLPAIPPPYYFSYRCQPASSYRNVNNSGWLPIDFTFLNESAPLSVLPVDPINTSTGGLYYTHTIIDGHWELTAVTESQKYAERAARDGGVDPAMVEVGTNLTITPFIHGMIAYWRFDESSGIQVSDSSGSGNVATLNGGASFTNTDCKFGYCLLNVNDGYAVSGSGLINPATIDFSAMAWVKLTGTTGLISGSYQSILANGDNNHFWLARPFQIGFRKLCSKITGLSGYGLCSVSTLSPSTWYHVALTFNQATKRLELYLNGQSQIVDQGNFASPSANPIYIGSFSTLTSDTIYNEWQGSIDEVMIYNRALSAAEIKAAYNATK